MFLLTDGGIGTELLCRVGPPSVCVEALNTERPELVRALHADYRAAGARVLSTNTFGANRFRLQPQGDVGQIERLNGAGARLARAAAAGALVAGSIGPSGRHEDLPSPTALRAAYAEQAAALEAGGVDLFWCETFGDLGEARAAVEGVRAVSDLPIVLLFTFRPDGRTPTGSTPEEVAAGTDDLPLTALGVNCAIGPDTVERVIGRLAGCTDRPLAAQPNAGEPELRNGRPIYHYPAADFAALAIRLAPHVVLFGGCCGAGPQHIAAVHRLLAADEKGRRETR